MCYTVLTDLAWTADGADLNLLISTGPVSIALHKGVNVELKRDMKAPDWYSKWLRAQKGCSRMEDNHAR